MDDKKNKKPSDLSSKIVDKIKAKKYQKTEEAQVNEFNQVVEGNSLSKDAFRRLKKNKMALVSMVVVIIYALLSAFAPILPIYSYEEIVLDHQNLPPSLTKTSGELMKESMLSNIFAMAWRSGRLVVSEKEDAQLKVWIKENKTPKVWDFCYKEGLKQLEAGTFTYNSSEQAKVDKMNYEIQNEIFVSISKINYIEEDGDFTKINNISNDQLVKIYSKILGVDEEIGSQYLQNDVRSQIKNSVKSAHSEEDITDEELEALVDMEIQTKTQKNLDSLAKTIAISVIEGKIKKELTVKVEKELLANVDLEFPFKRTENVFDNLSVKLEVSKKHQRRYYWGTDALGRDLLARTIYGGQVSIMIGLVGTITSILIGILVGAIAGYVGGRTDFILMRIVDVLYGLPYMLLVIIFMAIFNRGIFNLFIALAMVSWLTIARMVRGQIMSLKNQEYIEAAKSMGASTARIILKHLVPNSLSIIIVYSTLRIPAFIMQESFLSFLGLGVQAPFASWGSLVQDSINGMTNYPWRLIYPALTMTVFLFAMNFFGDGLRDAFDPQSKNML